MKHVFVLAAIGLLGVSVPAQAGQFKNVQTNSLGNGLCIPVHSSPQNEGNAGSAAMQMEIYEFIPPAPDGYKCCISANTTNRKLFVRLINVNGAQLSSFQTVINGGGCTGTTGYVTLTFPFAYQCTVATGPNAPVGPGSGYTISICRQ